MNIEFKGLKVMVIGGNGSYGRWWARVFKELECVVRIVTEETLCEEKSELTQWATIIWSAAPYEATMKYVADFSAVMTDKQLFVSTSSLQQISDDTLNRLAAEYVGIHVLADVPKLTYFTDETIAWCYGPRLVKFKPLVKVLLQKLRAKHVQKIRLCEHDDLMLWQTTLPRLLILLMGLIIFAMRVDLKMLSLFQTKFGRVVYEALRRLITQSNGIEAEVLTENPRTGVLIDAAIRFLFILRVAIRDKDKQTIMRLKQDMKDYFGKEFLEEPKG